jgi:hypothetical protein
VDFVTIKIAILAAVVSATIAVVGQVVVTVFVFPAQVERQIALENEALRERFELNSPALEFGVEHFGMDEFVAVFNEGPTGEYEVRYPQEFKRHAGGITYEIQLPQQ